MAELNTEDTIFGKSKQPNCDCLEKIEVRLKEFHTEQSKKTLKNFTLVSGKWERQYIFPSSQLYSNYVIKYTFEKVNGETSKEKNDTVSIAYSYCPFCGTQYKNK